jgi:2-C-methyl-D-erythritol 4-phosphate cytidylyltransferase
MSISLILLAGGSGTRMREATPKQFLPLCGKPIVHYSLDIFLKIPEIKEIIVVAAPPFRSLFSGVKFADPGDRRQDSVFNGLQQVNPTHEWVMTHDAARPLFTLEMVQELICVGKETGAATLAVPLKPTIKERDVQGYIEKTLNRAKLVEIQTPQFLARETFMKGFRKIASENIEVTDDTSIAELLQLPVKVVMGCYSNIKITTPEDLWIAESFLSKKACSA